MCTHNICFRGEIRDILCGDPILPVAMVLKATISDIYCVSCLCFRTSMASNNTQGRESTVTIETVVYDSPEQDSVVAVTTPNQTTIEKDLADAMKSTDRDIHDTRLFDTLFETDMEHYDGYMRPVSFNLTESNSALETHSEPYSGYMDPVLLPKSPVTMATEMDDGYMQPVLLSDSVITMETEVEPYGGYLVPGEVLDHSNTTHIDHDESAVLTLESWQRDKVKVPDS